MKDSSETIGKVRLRSIYNETEAPTIPLSYPGWCPLLYAQHNQNMPGISEEDSKLVIRNGDGEQDENRSCRAGMPDEKQAGYYRMDYWSEEILDEGSSEGGLESDYDSEDALTDESDFIDDSEDLENLVDSDGTYDSCGSDHLNGYTSEDSDELSDESDLYSPSYSRERRLLSLQENCPQSQREDMS